MKIDIFFFFCRVKCGSVAGILQLQTSAQTMPIVKTLSVKNLNVFNWAFAVSCKYHCHRTSIVSSEILVFTFSSLTSFYKDCIVTCEIVHCLSFQVNVYQLEY